MPGRLVAADARNRGLLLRSCGTYGNVIRIMAPLTVPEPVTHEGLGILEDALAAMSIPAM